jgi:hypothetical protein
MKVWRRSVAAHHFFTASKTSTRSSSAALATCPLVESSTAFSSSQSIASTSCCCSSSTPLPPPLPSATTKAPPALPPPPPLIAAAPPPPFALFPPSSRSRGSPAAAPSSCLRLPPRRMRSARARTASSSRTSRPTCRFDASTASRLAPPRSTLKARSSMDAVCVVGMSTSMPMLSWAMAGLPSICSRNSRICDAQSGKWLRMSASAMVLTRFGLALNLVLSSRCSVARLVDTHSRMDRGSSTPL